MQKPCTRKYTFVLALMAVDLLFLFFPACPGADAAENQLPFFVGETLTYDVSWEMVQAGQATFRVRPFATVKGKKAWHFDLKVKSNQYIDMFYKIRDRMEGFADETLTRSVFYKKTSSGKNKKQIELVFDWENQKVTYSNYGGSRDPIKIPPYTFDPVSAFYKMRTIDFNVDQTIAFPVTDGKKQFMQKAHVKKRQTLMLSSGPVDTFLIIPDVNYFSGVFEKSENPTVQVWVTADKRKIPVRIKVKVFIGSLIFDLSSDFGLFRKSD